MQDLADDTVRFVVGLGNPGPKYARTRHNVGFMVLDALRRRWQAGDGRSAFSGRLYDVRVAGPGGSRRVMMLEPHTYMNRSGQAVTQMTTFYKAQPQDVLVVMDDLALPPGKLRFRAEGSSGGHKGLADIMAALGTPSVPRLRIGIGAAPPPMDGADYVLSAMSPRELAAMGHAVELAAQAVEEWVFQGLDRVMEKYNRKARDADEPA